MRARDDQLGARTLASYMTVVTLGDEETSRESVQSNSHADFDHRDHETRGVIMMMQQMGLQYQQLSWV